MSRVDWQVMGRILSVVFFLVGSSLSASAQTQCGPTDLVFVIDNTGSMAQVNAEIQDQVAKISDAVVLASGGDYQLGLVALPENDVSVLLDLAPKNRAALPAATEKLVNAGSCGLAASWDEGLKTVLNRLGPRTGAQGEQIGSFNGNFRADATKIIILITDTDPSGFECDMEVGVHDKLARDMATLAKTRGIKITSVYVPTGGGSDRAVVIPIMRDVARITESLYRETAPDASDLSDVIVDVIRLCGGQRSALVVEPEELGLTIGDVAELEVTNFRPGNLATLFYDTSGLPAGSQVTFTRVPPEIPGTDRQIMRLVVGSGDEHIPDLIASVHARHTDTTRVDSDHVRIFLDCRPPAILGVDQPRTQTVARGTSATFQATPYGSGSFQYQWYEGFSGMTFSPIPGATGSTLTTGPITQTTPVWVRITNVCGSYDSMTATAFPR